MDLNSPGEASPQEQIQQTISRLWLRFRDSIFEQVARIEAAAAASAQKTLSEEQRAGALSDAHKLAGSLGTFGFPKAGEIARECEHLFAAGEIDSTRAVHLAAALHKELSQAASAVAGQ